VFLLMLRLLGHHVLFQLLLLHALQVRLLRQSAVPEAAHALALLQLLQLLLQVP
jgi:hypothetical protein